MPYIDKNSRKKFSSFVAEMDDLEIYSAGELNYLITKLCHRYIKIENKISYTLLNEIVGVLECAKQEIYRRIVSEYEDSKIKENGDIIL